MTDDTPLIDSTHPDRRRQTDRRAADRHGKYDRRKNRCGMCTHYADREPVGDGFCLFHHKPLTAEDFACLEFEEKPKPSI